MRLRSVVTAMALGAGSLAVSGAAAADPGDVTCPLGTQTGTYSPGLTYTTRTVTFRSSGTLAGCVAPNHPGITGAAFSGSGSGPASCTAATLSNTSIYTWNDGRTSTVQGRMAVNLKPNGTTVLILTGEVTSGLFRGATAIQTKIMSSAALTACLTPEGLTSVSGPVSLTLAL